MTWLDVIEKQIREDKALSGDKGFVPKDVVRLSSALRLLAEVARHVRPALQSLSDHDFEDGEDARVGDLAMALHFALENKDCRALLEVDDVGK